MLIKIHKTEDRKIVSLCDETLIGKKFEEGDLQLEVSEFFYKGDKMDEEEILGEMRAVSSLNIVGKEAIQFALKHNLISKQNIIKIQNIPHALTIVE